ncbi:MAG: hypothetical protein R3348_05970 [Xanthomonadales bacterium]|nr:hypothetical protein [Xanthomonadales bacterium]
MNAWDIDPFYQLGTWKELWNALKKATRKAVTGDAREEEGGGCCAEECCA